MLVVCQCKLIYICYLIESTILNDSTILLDSKLIIMVLREDVKEHVPSECKREMLPVMDALEVLNGKWKLPIIISVSFGKKRFKEISKEVSGITDKVLSKELKDLEMNKLVTRTVHDTFPPRVEYSITKHGESLQEVIRALHNWGTIHRKKIIGK